VQSGDGARMKRTFLSTEDIDRIYFGEFPKLVAAYRHLDRRIRNYFDEHGIMLTASEYAHLVAIHEAPKPVSRSDVARLLHVNPTTVSQVWWSFERDGIKTSSGDPFFTREGRRLVEAAFDLVAFHDAALDKEQSSNSPPETDPIQETVARFYV